MKKELYEEEQAYVKMLSSVAPGTYLREGIDNILDAGFGALIIVGYDNEVKKMIDGGFFIDCEYSPERLFELSKMDGAIILDNDCSKILYANVHLQVNREIPSTESGTRHRTAQRAGGQTNKLVIAISERKKIVTLYKDGRKCKMKSLSGLIEEATQTVNTLEKYKNVLDKVLKNLTTLELEGTSTLEDVATVLQRFEMLRRRELELEGYIKELGNEGRLISFQNEELMQGIREEEKYFLADYMEEGLAEEDVYNAIYEIDEEDIFDKKILLTALGYNKNANIDEEINPKGMRILGKINKLSNKDIEKLCDAYSNLTEIKEATEEELLEIKMSKAKIKALKSGLSRLELNSELEK